MKGTTRELFGGATYHKLITGCDTQNRGMMLTTGGAMLITGALTLVTWPVMLVTCLYMLIKMAARLLDRTLLEQVGDKAVERCGLLAFISWLSHLVLSEHGPGQGTVGVS